MSRTDPQLAEIEAQIAETREALGQTVEELAAKADVPGRAKAKARETAERLRGAEHRTREKAALARGRTRERALHAKDATQERAALTAGRVRESAGSAASHLPGRGNGKAAEHAGDGTSAPASSSTELTPTGTTGAHRVGPATAEEQGGAAGPSRRPLAVGAALAVAAALVLTWARRHDFSAKAAAPPPLPERIPWRVRASSRRCVPRAD